MKWWQRLAVGTSAACSLLCCSIEANFEEAACCLFQRAAESESDVVMVSRLGEVACIYGQDKELEPIESRSVTKTFVSLAVGIMYQQGYITSLDTPVYYFFPEWNQGRKKYVTIRHLLNHTSGIDAENDECALALIPDVVRYALASELNSCPGTRFRYNNKATNLLAGVVRQATGLSVHEYLKCRLFQPLGISSDTWLCDMAGNNYGMSHLTISAKDLAKVGILLANGGEWNGLRLLSAEWIDMMTQPSQAFNPFYGLLCWLSYDCLQVHWDQGLIDLYAREGVNPTYIRCLNALGGHVLAFQGRISYGNFVDSCALALKDTFGSSQAASDFFAEVENKGLPLGLFSLGTLNGFSARGYQGQQLVVLPKERIVGVRLARGCGMRDGQADAFIDMEWKLDAFAGESGTSRPIIHVHPAADVQPYREVFNADATVEVYSQWE